MAWMKHSLQIYYQWKTKWRLRLLGAVRIMVPLVERENFEKNAPEWGRGEKGRGRSGEYLPQLPQNFTASCLTHTDNLALFRLRFDCN